MSDNIVITVGTELVAGTLAEKSGICNTGTILEVVCVETMAGQNGEEHYIGVESKCGPIGMPGWDGIGAHNIHPGMGRYLSQHHVLKMFKVKKQKMVTALDVTYYGRSLLGKKGKVIEASPDSATCMVEFEENIGGGSGDGVGKKGHCALLKKNELRED